MSESKNSNLSKAKNAKNDEFYTQYNDIEKEMQAYLDYDPNVFQGVSTEFGSYRAVITFV